jgi:predicted dehydrogenase
MADLRVAVIGAGVIGRTHVQTLARAEGLRLAAIVDPAAEAAALAAAHGVPHFRAAEDLAAAAPCDAAIVASPSHTHAPIAAVLMRAGLPVLMEKPVAGTPEEGAALRAVAAETGLPLLVGHHRRHTSIVRAAKAAIEAGEIGALVTATITATLSKPPDYFDVAWRRTAGQGGPLLINLTHEIDMLRHFFGAVATVQGTTSHARRGLEVEDTAAAILTFRDGGMATLAVTDAACGPWAWDMSAGENPARFPAHDVSVHHYSGTCAGLSLPDLSLWRHPGPPDWTVKMERQRLPHAPNDCYVAQLEHFAEVVRGTAQPLCDLEDGLANMAVVAALQEARSTGRVVTL